MHGLGIFVVGLILATVVELTVAGAASRQAAVNKAIEQTKSRLTPSSNPQRIPQRSNVRLNADQPTTSSPGKIESLDVDKLNRLIRTLDRTWILPKSGAKEPVGSNFQYKKTCASIYKARHGACQQLGFGVMCFNYCHERGEKLAFKCQDTSDASYCKQSGTFDTFLAKYRKDGYKAKAYIHQMISRCYSTTICNTQSGILNSTIIDEEPEVIEKTTRANRLKLLTKKPSNGSPLALMKLKTKKAKTTTTEKPIEEVDQVEDDEEEDEDEVTTTTKASKKPKNAKKKGALRGKPTPPPEPSTTTKANIWDKFTVGNKAKPTPKYIPFWQRLMSTTLKPQTEEAEPEAVEDGEEEPEESVEVETTSTTIKNVKTTTTAAKIVEEDEEDASDVIPAEDIIVRKTKVHKTNPDASTTAKHTFKPLPMTVPPPSAPELAHQKPNIEPGFWNRFQPNRWFESIHYVTNTGK